MIDIATESLPTIADDNILTKYINSVLQDGDVVIADAAEDETVGKCSEIKGCKGRKVLAGLHTIPVRPKVKYANGFLGYFMNSDVYHNQLLPLMQGTKVSSISKTAIQDTSLNIPSDIEEQKSIADYFMGLDNLITLHQCKPKEKRQWRINAWEQRKLGEIGFAKSGVGFPDSEQGGTEGIPFYKVSDMNIQGNENELVSANNYVSKEQISRKKWKVIDDVPAIFFAKVGAAVMLNRKRLVRFPFLLDNNTMAYIFDKNVWDCDFGKTLFETVDLTQLAQTGALPSYNASDVEGIEITLPKKDEQKKIGEYFASLDNLITLHQRKSRKVCESRSLAWEQRKLGDICERVTRKNKNNESDLPLTIASQFGLLDQRDFFNKVVAAKDMSNYYLLKKGEFAYNKSYSNGFDYGSIKRLNAYEQGCLSTLYICFGITSDEVESDYLECFFDTLKWYGDVSMICAEGARNHGLLNVDTKGFFDEVTIDLPKSLEEQKKISAYLNALDNLVTLHQR